MGSGLDGHQCTSSLDPMQTSIRLLLENLQYVMILLPDLGKVVLNEKTRFEGIVIFVISG